MMTDSNKPIVNFGDGNIRAKIWRNQVQGKNGDYSKYTVQINRIYTDQNGQIQESNSFDRSELLKLSLLAEDAYCRIQMLIESDKQGSQTVA